MKRFRTEGGFSLLELLLVMAVIAIIVAIALPSFRGMRSEAAITKAEGELQTLKTAVESYYRHHGQIPTSLSQLYTASPAIVTKELKDPFKTAGNTYRYIYNFGRDAVGNYIYVIYSKGPDGKDTRPTIKNNGTSKAYVSVKKTSDEIVVSNVPVVRE